MGFSFHPPTRALQENKFRALLRRILPSNDFYAARIGGIDVLSDVNSEHLFLQLPLISRNDLLADQQAYAPFGSNLTFPITDYKRIFRTSGTSRSPLICLDTEESWAWWATCWKRVLTEAGICKHDRIMIASDCGPFIGYWSALAGAHVLGAEVIPSGTMTPMQNLKAIVNYAPTVLICLPSVALQFLKLASAAHIPLGECSLHTIVAFGEPGGHIRSIRQRIETGLSASCIDHAGATEVGAWGYQKRGVDGLFINEDEFIFEVLDPVTGQSATSGELVLTNLGRFGMPVIRYRTGDMVTLSDDDAFAFPHRRLKSGIIGRVDDLLTIEGVKLYPSAIEDYLFSVGYVRELQIQYLVEAEKLVIAVELEPQCPESISQIENRMRAWFHMPIHLNESPQGSLPRYCGKAHRFIRIGQAPAIMKTD